MPRLDSTGPLGYGPRTGRGFGPCCVGFRRFASVRNNLIALEEEEKFLEEELAAIREEKVALKKQENN